MFSTLSIKLLSLNRENTKKSYAILSLQSFQFNNKNKKKQKKQKQNKNKNKKTKRKKQKKNTIIYLILLNLWETTQPMLKPVLNKIFD